MQEVGGKDYEKYMKKVDGFVQYVFIKLLNGDKMRNINIYVYQIILYVGV